MHWKYYLIALLIAINAGYMVVDGIHAFATGDYITPKSGPSAGQLGPWSKVVQAIGLGPRSNLVKTIFVLQGIITLALLACFLFRVPWATTALKVAAIAGLWYLPIGTVINIVVLVLLFIP
jgi:hypothetical protein